MLKMTNSISHNALTKTQPNGYPKKALVLKTQRLRGSVIAMMKQMASGVVVVYHLAWSSGTLMRT